MLVLSALLLELLKPRVLKHIFALGSLLLVDLKHAFDQVLALITYLIKLNVLVVEVTLAYLSEDLICSGTLKG